MTAIVNKSFVFSKFYLLFDMLTIYLILKLIRKNFPCYLKNEEQIITLLIFSNIKYNFNDCLVL